MHTRASLWVTIGIALAACAGEPAPPAVQPAQVSPEQFGRLRWLEGRWRGAEGAGAPFFEAYYFQDDSTIRSYNYADSAMAAPTDSGLIQLRGGTVTSGSPAPRWIVTGLDSLSATFADTRNARSGFTWRAAGPGAWTATLHWDSAGVPRERIYDMRAVP